MKRFLVLLWVSFGFMLIPSAAYSQGPGDASAKLAPHTASGTLAAADAQPSPVPATTDVQPVPAGKTAPAEPMTIGLPPRPPTIVAYPHPPLIDHVPQPLTVINYPKPPFMDVSVSPLVAVTPSVASPSCLQQPCPQGLQVGRFSNFVPAAAQVGAKTSVDSRFAFEASLAQGFAKIHSFTFVAEFPVVFTSNGDVNSGNTLVARSYSSLFFTPALRIVLAPDRDKHQGYPAIYPWISLGGGLAHFSPSATNLAGTASGAQSSTEGALQAGAGADFGIYRKAIALRAEVRDFYTGPPNLGVPGINLRHNVVAGGGIVFRICKECWKLPPATSPDRN